MKAIVYTGPQELRFQDVQEPQPGPGEVCLRVEATGICGSELHGVASESPFRVPPLIMGHEFIGTREDTGQRAVINPLLACGHCDLCLRGQANVCRSRAILGIQRAGSYAERVAVPEPNLYPAPQGLTAEAGALVEPLANAVHAWRLAGESSPQRVGVIGAGTMGLVSLIIARARGVPEVHVTDLVETRLDVARRLGATETGPALDGEYDLVIDGVGSTATRAASLERVRPGGTAVWIGLHDEDSGFSGPAMIRNDKAVRGSFCYTHVDFADAVQLATRIDTSWVTTLPLSDGVEAFTELMHGRTDLLKVQLVP